MARSRVRLFLWRGSSGPTASPDWVAGTVIGSNTPSPTLDSSPRPVGAISCGSCRSKGGHPGGREPDAARDFRHGLLPAAVASNDRLARQIWVMHAAGAFLLIALVALHVAAALRHAWLLRDGVLRRMTPFRSP